MSDIIKLTLFVAIIIALIIVGPIVTIWSINTLFGLTTEVTFWSWLAAFWLQSLVVTRVSYKK